MLLKALPETSAWSARHKALPTAFHQLSRSLVCFIWSGMLGRIPIIWDTVPDQTEETRLRQLILIIVDHSFRGLFHGYGVQGGSLNEETGFNRSCLQLLQVPKNIDQLKASVFACMARIGYCISSTSRFPLLVTALSPGHSTGCC